MKYRKQQIVLTSKSELLRAYKAAKQKRFKDWVEKLKLSMAGRITRAATRGESFVTLSMKETYWRHEYSAEEKKQAAKALVRFLSSKGFPAEVSEDGQTVTCDIFETAS